MNNVIKMINRTEAIYLDNDMWHLLDQDQYRYELSVSTQIERPLDKLIIPFELWITGHQFDSSTTLLNAFSLENTTDVHLLKPWLDKLKLIVLDFPKFTDGRAYSQAVELRRYLGWKGELRANGDVLRDQLSHMQRCGFDSFAIRPDKNPNEALKGLSGISVLYANSVVEPQPLFRRRTR